MERTWWLFLSIVLLFLSTPRIGNATEASLRLFVGDGRLYVTLENGTSHKVKLRNGFSLDSMTGNLEILIKQDARVFPLLSHVESNVPGENDYSNLRPAALSGRAISVDLIAEMYGLKEGCYELSAKYRDLMHADFSAYSSELHSNTVRLCIDKFTSSEELNRGEALRITHDVLGSSFKDMTPLPSEKGGEESRFFSFTARSKDHSTVDVLVNRRTREVWVKSGQQCVRYGRPGSSGVYDSFGATPEGCPPSKEQEIQ